MKKLFNLLITLAVSSVAISQNYTTSAPAQCTDVMLQGFYWNSYEPVEAGSATEVYGRTKWVDWLRQTVEDGVTTRAEEASQWFDLIWLPPMSKSTGGLGYHPSNYNKLDSDLGQQKNLVKLIEVLHQNGARVVADIVINHADGEYGWCAMGTYDFGEYGTFTPDGSYICQTDEVNYSEYAPSECKGWASGNSDDGYGDEANYPASRDWDHSNSEVRTMFKAYLQWMRNEVKVDGFRYDYCKGYHNSHINEYNRAAEAYFSVMEVWEGNVNALTSHLTDAEWNTLTFDFATKYQAFNNGIANDYYQALQSPGLLGVGKSRYAVTFVDSHDSFLRDDNELCGLGNSMTLGRDKVLQCNAYILSMPGVPCVFWPHWVTFKEEIKAMINARYKTGVHSESAVSYETGNGYYKATITGTNGEIRLLLGPNSGYNSTPAGYALAVKGTNYGVYYKLENERGDKNTDRTSCTIASGTCGENLTWELSCDSVLTISGTGAMEDNPSWTPYKAQIRTAVLPEGLTYVGREAFYHCSALTSINLPNSVDSIGVLAFVGCDNLTEPLYNTRIFAFMPRNYQGSYSIPEGIVDVASYAFNECISESGTTSIPEIIIPSSTLRIGAYAFGSHFQKITCMAVTPPVCNYSAFCVYFDEFSIVVCDNSIVTTKKSTPIYVPAGSVEAYKSAEVWKDFFNILPIEGSIEPHVLSIAEAIKIGMALDSMATSAETYTVEGYVINAETFSQIYKNQIWYMADDENAASSDFEAYRCFVIEGEDTVAVENGYKVQMTGFLHKYYKKSTASYVVEMSQTPATILSKPQIDTITVAQALAIGIELADGESTSKQYVIQGYVSSISQNYSDQYKNESFWITDEKGNRAASYADGAFYVYRGRPNTEEEIGLDTKVSFLCNIKNYKGTVENAGTNIPVDVIEEHENTVPRPSDLAKYGDLSSDVVLAFYFDEEICNDLVLVGTYNEWNTDDVEALTRFEKLEGFDGWYVAAFPWTEGAQGKAVQLKSDGTFDWIYQTGDVDAWINQGGKEATIEAGYIGESNVGYPEPGAYIYEIAYFKLHNTPCEVVPKHKYTIVFLDPYCEENEEFVPAIAGDHNGWSFSPLSEGTYKGEFAWVIVVETEEGNQFKFAEYTRGWPNQFEWYDEENDAWKQLGNSAFPVATQDTTLVFDYSDTDYFRYAKCGAENPEPCLIASGTCGENLTWTLSCDSVLTISGAGAMRNYSFNYSEQIPETPWNLYLSNIKSVIIEDGVTSIGSWAFDGCSNCISFEIKKTVTSIGKRAFSSCISLSSLNIPESVMSIGVEAFFYCPSLSFIEVDTNNMNFCSIDGVLFSKDRTTLICYPSGKEGVYTIPQSVTSIFNSAFNNCSGLPFIEIPNSVTEIGSDAFFYCTSLTSLTIGSGVTNIGKEAFYNCYRLTTMTSYATTPPSCGYEVFTQINKSIPLYVPAESAEAYKTAEVWKDFFNILPIEGTVEPMDSIYNVVYIDHVGEQLDAESVTLHMPDAPVIEGFTFLKWQIIASDLENGIHIQAAYKADEPSNTPAVYTNPANKAQKLIRNGNIYILTGNKTYTATGQEVK